MYAVSPEGIRRVGSMIDRSKGGRVDSHTRSGNPEGGTVMPRGVQQMRDPANAGQLVLVDLTPRLPDGTPVAPPVIPPEPPHTA